MNEALKIENLEFVLNGYRNKKCAGLAKTAANSLLFLNHLVWQVTDLFLE